MTSNEEAAWEVHQVMELLNIPYAIIEMCIRDSFYTKLLRLAEMMQTETGRREGERRTALMRLYLDELGRELSGGGLAGS